VVCARVDADLDTRSGSNSGGGSSGRELVATDVAAGYITNEAVVLPVLGLTIGGPRRRSINGRQSVYDGEISWYTMGLRVCSETYNGR
jgi:hypothetical protein